MKNVVALALAAAAVVVVSNAACPAAGGGAPTPEQSAPVEKTVRDLYAGYTGASTGDQRIAALTANATPAFIDGLKAKATACQQSASSGKPDAACDADPVVCAPGNATLTTVVVQSASANDATATAVVTPEGGAPKNVRVTLSAGKVQSIECPK